MISYEIEREKDNSLFCLAHTDNVTPSHFHKKIEILYVEEGEKKIITNNKMYVLNKGDLFIADSYVIHSYLDSHDGKQTCIVFSNKYLTNYFNLYGDKVLKNNIIRDHEFTKKLVPLIENVEKISEDDALLYQGNIDMLLGYIVREIGLEEKQYNYNLGLIGDIITYIDENYQDEITLDKLADHFGYSKYYFSRLFNSCMGTSITDYISIIRINKVLEMLKTNEVSISDAIFSCGFSSVPTFYRVLKKNYFYKKIEDLLI